MDEEKIIIGGWLLGYHTEDIERLEPSDFFNYGVVVKAIKAYGTDVFKLHNELGKPVTEFLEMTSMYTETFYMQAVSRILENKAKYYLATVKPDTPIRTIAETLLEYDLRKKNIDSLPEPASSMMMHFLSDLDERTSAEPVNWGLPSLDRVMGGIRKKELTTIGGRPGTGKSAMMLQIVLSIVKQGKKVLYFPLEMSETQTIERVILRNMNINHDRLRKGTLNEEEWKKMNLAADTISKLEQSGNFLLFEGVNNLSTISRLVEKHKPFAVAIDQLTQMTDDRYFREKREQFSHMTSGLKRMAMLTETAVFLAAQVNRDAQQAEPTLANLKESGSIEEDSDNVILLHRIPNSKMAVPEDWDENKRPLLVKVEKQRSGSPGRMETVFMASRFAFYDLDNTR